MKPVFRPGRKIPGTLLVLSMATTSAPAYADFADRVGNAVLWGLGIAAIGAVFQLIFGAGKNSKKSHFNESQNQGSDNSDYKVVERKKEISMEEHPTSTYEQDNYPVSTLVSELERIADLRKNNHITDEEFHSLKSKIIGR